MTLSLQPAPKTDLAESQFGRKLHRMWAGKPRSHPFTVLTFAAIFCQWYHIYWRKRGKWNTSKFNIVLERALATSLILLQNLQYQCLCSFWTKNIIIAPCWSRISFVILLVLSKPAAWTSVSTHKYLQGRNKNFPPIDLCYCWICVVRLSVL